MAVPDDLVQMIQNGSVETTQELMKDVDVVVATGGGAMVRSAYSSGKPSYGVGAGNVPVIIDRGVDLKDAVEKIVTGAVVRQRHHLLARAIRAHAGGELRGDDPGLHRDRQGVVHRRQGQGAEAPQCRVPRGHLNKDVVGRSPAADRRDGRDRGFRQSARIILLPADGAGTDDVLALEKLCPVVAILPYSTFEEAVAAPRPTCWSKAQVTPRRCTRTTSRTSADMGLELPISRLVVNQASRADRGRFADQRFRADHDARLRLVGRQLHLGESGLQAPHECLADREGDRAQEGADRRRDLELEGLVKMR